MAYYRQCQQYDFFYCILFILMVKCEQGGEIMGFKGNLKSYRELKKYTRSQMAKKLGMTSTAYGAYELGNREPNLDKLCDIAKILEVTPNDLLGYSTDQSVEYSRLQKEFHRFGFLLVPSPNGKSADGNDLYVILNLEEKDGPENETFGSLTLEMCRSLLDEIFQSPEYKNNVHFWIIQGLTMIKQSQTETVIQQLKDFVAKESDNPEKKELTDFLRKMLKM